MEKPIDEIHSIFGLLRTRLRFFSGKRNLKGGALALLSSTQKGWMLLG